MTEPSEGPSRQSSQSAQVADILAARSQQRWLLLGTVEGLTEEQARSRPTVSRLSLSGILKHLAQTEDEWLRFAQQGTGAFEGQGEDWDAQARSFTPEESETLEVLVARYVRVSEETDRLLATLDLDTAHELPPAPWFAPGATRTVRGVAVHLLAEIAQHCGHADILREAIDGRLSMG